MDESNGSVSGEELVEGLLNEVKVEVPKVENVARKQWRFEKDAHLRVLNSFYSKDLNKLFAGQFNVTLLEVEKAILEFEQKDSNCRKKGIKLDPDTSTLTECQLNLAHVCGIRFFAKTWDKKEGKKDEPGNFSPDFKDEEGKEFVILAVCPPCYDKVCRDIADENEVVNEKNIELKKQGKPLLEERLFPRSFSFASAQDAFDRRAYAIKMQTQGKQIALERAQKRISETEQDTRRAVNRVASARPSLPPGTNRKNGTRWGRQGN